MSRNVFQQSSDPDTALATLRRRIAAAETLIRSLSGGGGGGVTDHGALTGLGDDDHTQYLNNSRGDARYWALSTDLATQTELDAHAALTTSAHGGIVSSADARLTDQRVPTAGSVDASKIANSLKPTGTAAAATEALRALGTTSSTAAAGNDIRLSDARTPLAHTQTASTITDFATAADARITAQRGIASGIASLDGSGRIPSSQLPVSALEYLGTWNASTNAPALGDGTAANCGNMYRVTTAGSTNFGSGTIVFDVGDYVICNVAGTWEKADTTDSVSSFNARTGAITPASGDYTAVQVTNTPSGAVAATTVQAAINELDIEKAALAGAAFTGPVTVPNVAIGAGLDAATIGSVNTALGAYLTTTGAAAAYLPLVGGTITGNFTIDRSASAVQAKFLMKVAAGQNAQFQIDEAGIERWSWGKDAATDDFFWWNGTALATGFNIAAATNIASFTNPPTFPTATAGDSSTKGANTAFVAAALAAATAASATASTAGSTAGLALGTTAADIPGATITTAAGGKLLVIADFDFLINTNGTTAIGTLVVAGAVQTRQALLGGPATTRATASQTWYLTGVAAGAIIKLQGARSAGTADANATHTTLTVIRLGP